MKMEGELKDLKMVLRSLVVSSPTEVDLRTLLRDYRSMMGVPVPFAKFGYRDSLSFIKEKCGDCFVMQQGSNPVLTLIVPDAVKHIDKFVQKQKVATTRFKAKRRSVPEEALKKTNLIVQTFKDRKTDYSIVKVNEELNDKNSVNLTNGVCGVDKGSGGTTKTQLSSNVLQSFMKKRIPALDSCKGVESDAGLDRDSSKGDADSGRQTSSTNSSTKKEQLEELKVEIRELIHEVPEGVWCTELMKLYREKYGRELNFTRFGFTSVLSLAYAVEELDYCVAEHKGELLLLRSGDSHAVSARPTRPTRPAHSVHTVPRREQLSPTGDLEDALPGIDFDADVFPRDCMHLMQSIAPQPIDGVATGAMLEVILGEVYSPTHFWLLRLGPAHFSAMEQLMDEMNEYYRGEGAERVLAGGAVRVGHYCACSYQGDWHRAVIVKVLDSDTVKVRHIDYATVESVGTRGLKPLLQRWATLPAQAVRARLAGVRPTASGRRWPWAAAAHFLDLVRDRRLVANVVAKDVEESILEILLIDTSTEEDVCISTEMCRSGHADARPDSALGTSECYLYPRFDALETGDTPNYAELYCYLRDGISLEFVEDYRRHVPPCLPPPPALIPSFDTHSAQKALAVDNRIPLLQPEARSGPRNACSSPTKGFPASRCPHGLPPPPRLPDPSLQLSLLAPPPTDGFPGRHPDCSQCYLGLPAPAPAPAPPLSSGSISVPASEYEIFTLLNRVDPAAAHRYMVDALSRAVAATHVTCAAPAPVMCPRPSPGAAPAPPAVPPPAR